MNWRVYGSTSGTGTWGRPDEANGHAVNGVPHPINDGYFGGYPGGDTPTSVHSGGANFTYCDGYAAWVPQNQYLKQNIDPNVLK